ncbi:MAG: DUF692 domain-containing protein [Methylovirgula sp.]|nr:DUF692 domain-containing protein [Methylovirgula sp.]
MTLAPLPAEVGLGFKPQHFPAIATGSAAVGFFEVHAENYFGAGGTPHAQLAALRRDYALSIHGVGLSIGGSGPLDSGHLARLKELCDRYGPESFSEHLAWASHHEIFFNDLLPLPLNEASLARVVAHVDELQTTLQRRVLIENPASYLSFSGGTIAEPQFLAELAARTGCGLLLDVNNVYVSAVNLGFDPQTYLDAFPLGYVGEIHLAGHSAARDTEGRAMLIDTHGAPIADPVFALYTRILAQTGPLPSLIERDNDVPAWAALAAEAATAGAFLQAARAKAPTDEAA